MAERRKNMLKLIALIIEAKTWLRKIIVILETVEKYLNKIPVSLSTDDIDAELEAKLKELE